MKEKSSFSISIFWIIIVFYLDPGGYMYSYLSPTVNTILSFAFLIVAYLIFNFYYRNSKVHVLNLQYVNSYIVFIALWMVYFFAVYYGYNNNEGYPGIPNMILRNPGMFFKSLIVIPIVYFSMFSLNSFLRILIWSSIVIGLLFIVTIVTGLPLMKTWNADRNIGSAKRNFMYSYGIINFMIPLTICAAFLKFKISKKMLLAGAVALAIIIITLWRRDMVGVIEYIVILSFMVNFIQKKFVLNSISKYLNFRNIIITSFLLIILSVFASNILETTSKLALGTLGSIGIIEYNEKGGNTDKARMSLISQVGIVNAIKENFLTGTGYDKNWMTGDGGDKKWEGSDYIFLSAFAMYGIIGLIIFIPYYIISFKIIRKLLLLIRSNNKIIYKHIEYVGIPIVVGIAASAELVKNMIEYPNWFAPVGAIDYSSKYFIFFGLLLGSYCNLKFKFKKINMSND